MKVRLRFFGIFRSAAGASEIELEIASEAPTVKSTIQQLAFRPEFHDLKELLLNSQTSDPRPNALIMVSGREISVLNGLETTLTENDELLLLPVAHGG